jgi:hypothetical protein
MAKRKIKKQLVVDASTISVKDIADKVKAGAEVPVELRVAAIALIRKTVAEVEADLRKLEQTDEAISRGIKGATYDSIIDGLIRDGRLESVDEKPEFIIIAKDKTKVKVGLSSRHDDQFEVDPSLAAKSTLDLVPDQYKKVNITLNKAAIEADFNSGSLPVTLKRFCSKNPVDITKISVTIVKDTKEEDE